MINTEFWFEPLQLPKNVFYLYFDQDGNITDLLNYKKDIGTCIEVSEDFVTEFRQSGKSIQSFRVKIGDDFKLEQRVIKNTSLFFQLIELNNESTVQVRINSSTLQFIKSHSFIVIPNDYVYTFYIVDKINYNFLKHVINIQCDQMLCGFDYEYAYDKNNESILVKKNAESYGIVYE
jgi:hypothetical protein